MYLDDRVVKFLNTLKGKKYIHDSVTQTGLQNVSNFQNAYYVIADQIQNFIHPRIITNTGNQYPRSYKKEVWNKQSSIALYRGEPENLFYKNKGLYKLSLFEVKRESKKINELFSTKRKRLLIVGSGHSWQEIDYDKISKDIEIMVINYNFLVNANWHIYHDKRVCEDLKAVVFDDDRKIIGEETQGYGDYIYQKKYHHTGAEAVLIAKHMGYEKIYLSGFDYRPNIKGKFHTYECKNFYSDSKIKMFLDDFSKINFDNVFNLNRRSRLKKFQFKDKEVLYENN